MVTLTVGWVVLVVGLFLILFGLLLDISGRDVMSKPDLASSSFEDGFNAIFVAPLIRGLGWVGMFFGTIIFLIGVVVLACA